MPTSRTTFEEQLKTILAGVSNVGKIYFGRRTWRDPEDFRVAFTYKYRNKSYLRGWEIYRSGMAPIRGGAIAGVPLSTVRWVHTYTLRGYEGYEHEGSSEVVFQSQVDAVMQALLVNISLNDTVSLRTTDITATMDIDEFGDNTAHVCDISFDVEEEVVTTFS